METNPSSRSWQVIEGLMPERLRALAGQWQPSLVARKVGALVDDLRDEVQAAARKRLPRSSELTRYLAQRVLPELAGQGRGVVNASGILLPPGIAGPLSETAFDDLATAGRDFRWDCGRPPKTAENTLLRLSGAEACLVLSTHGAAFVAAMQTLARGRGVAVARGQITTVDGQYPLTAALADAVVNLVEVGQTNEVAATDFAQAAEAAVLLDNRPANFEIAGQHAAVELSELSRAAARSGAHTVANHSLISLADLSTLGLSSVPTLRECIEAGADLVICGSGGLIGGGALGLIVGRKQLVDQIAQAPLASALQPDPVALQVLSNVLEAYRAADRRPGAHVPQIPLLQMLLTSSDNLRHRATRLAPQIAESSLVAHVEVTESSAFVNEGRLADHRLESWSLLIAPRGFSAERLVTKLQTGEPAVLAATRGDLVELNLRTVLARQDEQLAAAFREHAEERPFSQPLPATAVVDSAE